MEIVIEDTLAYNPVLTGMAIMKVLTELYPERIPLSNPSLSAGMDTLLGGSNVREALQKGTPIFQVLNDWQQGLVDFKKARKNYLIYPES